MKLRSFVLLFLAVVGAALLSGCGSSATAIQYGPAAAATALGTPIGYVAGKIEPGKTTIPTHVVNAVAGHLDAELRKRSLAPKTTGERTIRIDAITTYYRMRSGFARMAVGVFAGKDGIECEVRLVDVATGETTGTFKVSAFNVLAVGSEDDVARMLAAEIAKALEARK